MARRSKADLVAEFHRLYDCVETMSYCRAEHPRDEIECLLPEMLIPRERYIKGIDTGEMTASQAVGGTREGLNDLTLGIMDQLDTDPEHAAKLLDCYRSKTGRDFWEDAGNPVKVLRAILKRGRIENTTEFRLVKEFVSHQDDGILGDEDRSKADQMLEDFEFSHPPDDTV